MARRRRAAAGVDADVAVVGAGLAGLTCALELAERGLRVVVVEAHGHVGGRASSWIQDGMAVESGLHRFLGYYRTLPRVLDRVGVQLDDVLWWEDEFEIRLPDGRRGVFGIAPFHRPIRTAAWVAGNRSFLSAMERVALGRLMVAGVRDYWVRPAWLDERSTAEYAHAHGVSDALLEKVLVPLTAGIFFLPPDRYSAYAFFGLLAQGFVRPHRARLGVFLGGMTDVMCGPIARAIERRGGEVRTDWPVETISVSPRRSRAVAGPRGELSVRHVVLATSLGPAQELIRRADVPRHGWFDRLLRIPSMPAATIQLELDRPVMELDRTTFAPGTVLGSFAEQSRTTFTSSAGRLSIILVPPEPFMDQTPERILATVVSEARRVGVELEGRVRDYRVIRHPEDFYSLAPGTNALRPPQRTALLGLTLAGDYTAQPWLGSMEGAAVSGIRAARAVLDR